MLILFQKALNQELSFYPQLTEVINDIYTYKPVDKTPPYIYITLHPSKLLECSPIIYGDVDIYLVVRESGLQQSIHLNSNLIELLNKKILLNYQQKEFSFIFQIRQTACTVDSDSVTKIYHYQGRLKIKGEN